MPITAYQHSLASPGYAPDTAHGALPPQVWTAGENIRFENGAPRTASGLEGAYTVTVSVLHAINIYTNSAAYWVLATSTALYTTDGNTFANITRVSLTTTAVAYAASDLKNWTSTSFGSRIVLNNGVDVPQVWVTGNTRARNLDNWPSGWIARSVRAYRNYLVAMNLTISADSYPDLVVWSDSSPYDATTLPAWTPVTTNDAGDQNLSDTPGRCVDGLALGGSFLVYKEDSVWAMTWTGGAAVMSFRKLFAGVGLLAPRCVQEFQNQHFFVSRGDIYVTDGVSLRSVAAGRVRERLFNAIDPDQFERTFTAVDHSRREIWVCYPTTAGFPTEALVWNYETDTWSAPRSLPATAHFASGVVMFSDSAGLTFDTSVGTAFDADTELFTGAVNTTELALLACVPSIARLYRVNAGNTIPTTASTGVAFDHSLTRKLLPFVGQDATGQPALWSPVLKTIRRVWLDATGTGVIEVYLGVHVTESSTPTWHGPYRVDLSSQNFVLVLLRGRFFSIKFESDSGSSEWALTGYRIEWEPTGGF